MDLKESREGYMEGFEEREREIIKLYYKLKNKRNNKNIGEDVLCNEFWRLIHLCTKQNWENRRKYLKNEKEGWENRGFSAHIHMWDLSLWFSCISQFMEQTSVRLCLNNVEIHPVSKKTEHS